MKKTITLILTLATVILLCACGKATTDIPAPVSTSTPSESATQSNIPDSLANQNPIPQEIEISVEEYSYQDVKTAVNLQFKIRNISDKKIDAIQITYQAWDNNNDVISEHNTAPVYDLEAGQGGWTPISGSIMCPADNIKTIVIKSYTVSEKIPNKPNQSVILYSMDFPESIKVEMKDIPQGVK